MRRLPLDAVVVPLALTTLYFRSLYCYLRDPDSNALFWAAGLSLLLVISMNYYLHRRRN